MTTSRRHPLKTTFALLALILNDQVQIVNSLSASTPSRKGNHQHDMLASNVISRRDAWVDSATKAFAATMGCFGVVTMPPPKVWANADAKASSFLDLVSQIQQARQQLDKIPPYLEQEKWDSVRAVLLEKPLADCWAKTNRPLLTNYADAVGDAGGDELAALEAKEELVSHLRYLDMAVYNNNFNPITVMGKSGATKELIQSYYEDPINEFEASKRALEELLALSKDL